MKKITHLTFLVSCITLCFSSCKKDDFSSSYLKGKLDGVPFESNSNITANTPQPGQSGPSDPILNITGDWPGYILKLHINELTPGNNISAGTYFFESGKTRSATMWENNTLYYAGSSTFCFCPIILHGSGSITISSIDKKYVRGSFQFTSEPNMGITKTVTDGEFYIKRN